MKRIDSFVICIALLMIVLVLMKVGTIIYVAGNENRDAIIKLGKVIKSSRRSFMFGSNGTLIVSLIF